MMMHLRIYCVDPRGGKRESAWDLCLAIVFVEEGRIHYMPL